MSFKTFLLDLKGSIFGYSYLLYVKIASAHSASMLLKTSLLLEFDQVWKQNFDLTTFVTINKKEQNKKNLDGIWTCVSGGSERKSSFLINVGLDEAKPASTPISDSRGPLTKVEGEFFLAWGLSLPHRRKPPACADLPGWAFPPADKRGRCSKGGSLQCTKMLICPLGKTFRDLGSASHASAKKK